MTADDSPVVDVATLADLLHETAEHHDAFEKVSPAHDWWDWYAPYLDARLRGHPSPAAAADADRYIGGVRGVVRGAAEPPPPAADPVSDPRLPPPRLTLVYRLTATLAPPIELGATAQGHRRIVALDGGTFTGPDLNGRLLPGASADWQIVLPDGTALGDIRYTLRTDDGAVLYVRSRSIRHGSAEVLARLAHGDEVDAGEYTFRAATQIETADPALDGLNRGIFISVGGRQPGGVVYETYLVA
jgi:hypothetical protein